MIAIMFHLAFFSITTFVFPIDPVAFKPKFFFLGSILSKNDVQWTSPSNDNSASNLSLKNILSIENNLKSVGSEIVDRTDNPFAIQSIKKPLTPQTAALQNKIAIKSTFEILSEKEVINEVGIAQRSHSELKIQPYKPLKFRSP